MTDTELTILRAIDAAPADPDAVELSENTGIPVNTVRATLNVLLWRQIVRPTDGTMYRLTATGEDILREARAKR